MKKQTKFLFNKDKNLARKEIEAFMLSDINNLYSTKSILLMFSQDKVNKVNKEKIKEIKVRLKKDKKNDIERMKAFLIKMFKLIEYPE